MTEIERKALALLNEVLAERRLPLYDDEDVKANTYVIATLRRAIEQLEAFRQEVSDAVEAYVTGGGLSGWDEWERLKRLILPKPDPIAEVLSLASSQVPRDTFAERLAARGLKIVEDK